MIFRAGRVAMNNLTVASRHFDPAQKLFVALDQSLTASDGTSSELLTGMIQIDGINIRHAIEPRRTRNALLRGILRW